MTNVKTAYIGLGSNLGDRQDNIDRALVLLTKTENVRLLGKSEIIETSPLAADNQPLYLNTVAGIETTLSAKELHKRVIDIEAGLGRSRNVKWAPRTIDMDILLFAGDIINQPDLIIPHPQMHLRTFVLKGLCELNPALEHPVMKTSVKELLERLNNNDFVPDSSRPELISIAGVIGVGKSTLAEKLTKSLNCPLLPEPYDKNPFMPQVYAGKKELALDSQLFFLTHRVEQLNPAVLKGGQLYVTDYVFDKELIYANLQLNELQLELYRKIYGSLKSNVTRPVLVIHLTDTVENCLERIRSRNRPYEQKIETSFLNRLNDGYEKLFAQWNTSPVIRINASKLDYSDTARLEALIDQVKCYTLVKSTWPIKSVKV